MTPHPSSPPPTSYTKDQQLTKRRFPPKQITSWHFSEMSCSLLQRHRPVKVDINRYRRRRKHRKKDQCTCAILQKCLNVNPIPNDDEKRK
mmetsp:Transcript_25159/g.33375  ORF Transcript_25159/g.33375 Transcript_25159/m.33375 type:complete len:90 (-) Transcript_25159:54-323(-)